MKRKIYHVMQRLGFYRVLDGGPLVHIHCVSLGEAMIGHQIGRDLSKFYKVIYTTITDSGFKYLLKLNDVTVVALPLDNYFFVKGFFSRFEIKASVFIETEIWPELITQADERGIKLFLINARLSKRSYPKYKIFKFFFNPLLSKFDKILAQSSEELEKFIEMGVEKQKVFDMGNMKYDLNELSENNSCLAKIKSELNIDDNDLIIVAGSTFIGEEEILRDVYRDVYRKYNNCRLIVAPRHPHRFDSVYRLFDSSGFKTARRNSFMEKDKGWQVFILNTIGELKSFYGIGSIAFVGGSLVKVGGHNVIEPAYWSKPIIIGKYFYNFSHIIEDFKKRNAIIIVSDKNELYNNIINLFENKEYARETGINAKRVLDLNKGSLERSKKVILNDIKNLFP